MSQQKQGHRAVTGSPLPALPERPRTMLLCLVVAAFTFALAVEPAAETAQPPRKSWEIPACMDLCKAGPCTQFNGNLSSECGACTSENAKCYPGSDGFDTWLERRRQYPQLVDADRQREHQPKDELR